MQDYIINLILRRPSTLLTIILITSSQIEAATEPPQPAIIADNNSGTCQISEEVLNRLAEVIQTIHDPSSKIDLRMTNKPENRCSLIDNHIKDIYNLIQLLNTLKLDIFNVTFDLCVSKIKNQEYESAFAHYKKLHDDLQLLSIVSSAYNQDIDNLPNILKFISFLDSCKQQAVAYQELFDVIKHNNQLRHHKLLYFSDAKEECMSISLRNELDKYITEIINGLVTDYSTGNLNEALKYDKNFPQNEVSARFTIYSKLFDLLNNNQLNGTEMVTLAYRLRELDQICATKANNCSKQIKIKLSNFKLQIPSGMRALFWNTNVTIKSMKHDGYFLCSASNGKVYTYPNINSQSYNELCSSKWVLRPIGDSTYFDIVNFEDGTKLYGKDNKLYVGDYLGFAGHWQIFYVRRGSFYVFKNRVSGRGLDAGGFKTCASSISQCSEPWNHIFELLNPYQKWDIQ